MKALYKMIYVSKRNINYLLSVAKPDTCYYTEIVDLTRKREERGY